MRILLYSDYPALFQALQEEAGRYSGIEILQACPNTELLTLPDFQFMILAPLVDTAEAGATLCSAATLNTWQDKIKALIELCNLREAQLLLISSDLVFMPDQHVSSELDSPSNTSDLAKALLKLEKKVAAHNQSIILRTTPSLSASPQGGLAKLVASCLANESPNTVIDADKISYRGLQPLNDLARVLLGILLQVAAGAKAWGLYHYAGNEPVTQRELLNTLARYLNIDACQNIEASQSPDIKSPFVNQPSMSSQRLLNTFGVHPRAWREKLPELLEQLNESAKTT